MSESQGNDGRLINVARADAMRCQLCDNTRWIVTDDEQALRCPECAERA